jgi:Tfp pilus assembly PilM family ATPase
VKWLLNKNMAGFEIGPKALKMAVVESSKPNWRLVHWDSVPLPDGTVKPAFKSPNIVKPEEFNNAVQRLLKGYPGKIAAAGLSLPSEIIRVLIRGYPKLPDSRAEIEKLINWSLEKSFHFPIENTQISYQPTGHDGAGNANLLVTIGMKNVVQQFETLLAGQSVDTRVVRPASVNLYNFFAPLIPHEGTHAFLGLFENYFNFLVFEDIRLMFFHGVKRGFSDLQFFQDVDMTIQHYLDTNPGKRIERLYIGSQVGYHDELLEVLGNLIEIKVAVLKEHTLIDSPFDHRQPLERLQLSSFVSAIGAAQSLLKA